MKKFKTILVVAVFCFLGIESHAQLVSVRINLPSPPPPRQEFRRPPCPSPDYIWHEGRWFWDEYVRDYVWTAGFWEYAPPRRCEAPEYYSQRGKEKKHKHGRGNGRDKWRDRD
jgi:WXXGXW repeat (2 copies)